MKLIVILLSLVEVGLAFYYTRLFFQRLSHGLCAPLAMIAAMLLYFAGGTLTAYLTLSDTNLTAMLVGRGIDDSNVAVALVLTLLFASLLHACTHVLYARVTIPKATLVDALDRLALPPVSFTAACGLILGLAAFVITTGRLVFHGTETKEDVGSAGDPLLQLVQQSLYLLPLLCGYRLFVRGKAWASVPVLLASAGLAISQGRQKLIILLFFLLLGYLLNSAVKVKPAMKAALLASVAAFALIGFLLSIAVRMSSYSLPKNATSIEMASLAFKMMINGQGDRKTNVASATAENVDARAFNPEIFLAELSSANRGRPGAMGEVFVSGVVKAIPNVFWEEKADYVTKEEDIATRALHVRLSPDEGKTLLNGAYIDFREPGLLVYALFATLVIALTVWMLKATRLPLLRLLILCALLLTVLGTENSMVTWFLLLRSALVYLLADRLLGLFAWRDTRPALSAYGARMRREAAAARLENYER